MWQSRTAVEEVRAEMSVAEQITRGRTAAHLDVASFARLADLDGDRLAAIEGGAPAEPTEVDRCARVLGLRTRDLLAGAGRGAPMTMLLRAAWDDGRPVIEALAETGALAGLGEFHRAVRDLADVEARLGGAGVNLPDGNRYPGDPEREAKSFRLRGGLGMDPIPSLRDWLAERGVATFFTTPDELDRDIDGASTTHPRPAILVNLVGGGHCWWRTRMTLAHELAHILFDLDSRQTLFSPHLGNRPDRRALPGRWRLFRDFDDVEAHADAFAACLLAPGEAVREAVAHVSPTSEEAIARVGSRFGVGRFVAINRLRDVFGFSPEERTAMITRSRTHYDANFEGDRVEAGIGLRDGVLKARVAEALRRGALQASRAREMLGVDLTAPLPLEGLDEALVRPQVSADRRVLVAAQRFLNEHHPNAPLMATGAVAEGDGWRVELRREGYGPDACPPVGTLRLDARLGVVGEEIPTR